MDKAIREAVADLQQPGLDIEFVGPNGSGAKIQDPMAIVKTLCTVAARKDEGADPWPDDGEGEPVEFVHSEVARAIGMDLIGNIIRLGHLRRYRIHFILRHKENWTRAGKTVLGQMKRPSGLLKDYAEADFIVLLNRLAWNAMNPMQRVALVYHELRHGDGEGKVQGHDFEGFFDELELFGTSTYREWNALANAVDNGERVRHQFSLSLFGDETHEGTRDEAAEDAVEDPFPEPAGVN